MKCAPHSATSSAIPTTPGHATAWARIQQKPESPARLPASNPSTPVKGSNMSNLHPARYRTQQQQQDYRLVRLLSAALKEALGRPARPAKQKILRQRAA